MKALILDNKVVDVVSTEFEVHSNMTWVDCDNTVRCGYDYKDGKFTDPRALTDEQKAALAAVHYKRQRTGKEGTDGIYANFGDQLDMLWHSIDQNSKLKSEYFEFYEAIKAVKIKYPK